MNFYSWGVGPDSGSVLRFAKSITFAFLIEGTKEKLTAEY